jgi:hypothetical protein
MSDLGEQALNKVAEVGLSSQLDEVEELNVDIKTNPMKMVSGEVDSVSIQGEGLVMKKDLRVESMEVKTGNVAVNPLSAAFGKLELTRSTEASTEVVLTDADINRAFNSEFIQQKMQNLDVHINGEKATVNTQQVEFGLPGDQKIFLSTDVLLQTTNETKRVAFTAKPHLSPDGSSIVIEDIEYVEGQDLSPELTEALLAQARELLNLRNFELEGMSLRLQALDVQPGKLTLKARTHVEQIPSS